MLRPSKNLAGSNITNLFVNDYYTLVADDVTDKGAVATVPPYSITNSVPLGCSCPDVIFSTLTSTRSELVLTDSNGRSDG